MVFLKLEKIPKMSRIVLKATNCQEVDRSENYSLKLAMENGIESVKENAPDTKGEDVT